MNQGLIRYTWPHKGSAYKNTSEYLSYEYYITLCWETRHHNTSTAVDPNLWPTFGLALYRDLTRTVSLSLSSPKTVIRFEPAKSSFMSCLSLYISLLARSVAVVRSDFLVVDNVARDRRSRATSGRRADILILKHDSRKMRYFWVVSNVFTACFSFRPVWAPACRGLTRLAWKWVTGFFHIPAVCELSTLLL